MAKGDFLKARDLSGRGFKLSPVYGRNGPPTELAPEDRLFDAAIDKRTHRPDFVGTLQDQEMFSHWPERPIERMHVLLKLPQSHVYHVPAELGQFREFIQTTADYTHNRTPLAFTRAAFISVVQGGWVPSGWHFDTVRRPRVTYPNVTFVGSDKYPTEYLWDHPYRQLGTAFTQATQGLKPTQKMIRATDLRDLTRRPVVDRDIRSFEPYDISSHDVQTLHRGLWSPTRTSAVIGYAHSSVEASFLSSSPDNINPLIGDTMRALGIVTAPMEEAAERLQNYYNRYVL
ncbi:MAG: hypothetical protein GC136_03015 [Alphaproteobacteria bacterium]|nr:hypothetical protein [Alphaproteobacteria bacterium]